MINDSPDSTKTVWFNCCAGVAGDMLLASLIDAGASQLDVMDAWAALGVDGFAATWERVQRCGVGAMWTNIAIDDGQHHRHDDHDDHDHDHDHVHRLAREVLVLIGDAPLDPWVSDAAMRVYRTLAAVEGRVHGVDPDDVELHEVGALDSILDVIGVCAALRSLGITDVTYSPIAVGHGTVHTAHGQLPNPVPAVSHLLADARAAIVGIDTTMELATPTGVALLSVLGTCGPMPSMTITATGFGAGTADPPGRPNVVQAVVGTRATVDATGDVTGRPALLVEVNVDDTSGEVIAHTITELLAAGAHDAWATPILMKKGRPAHTVSALCDDAALASVRTTMLRETGSLGVRASSVSRWPQVRDERTVEVDGHPIRVKVTDHRVKVEFDDARAAAAALGRPVREILTAAEAAVSHL
ncbi:MAG TPA: nickel pincer cofactor biosynthesis protein LarC [Ilumatobacter sp.]|nr:nickel pincer cofactor biosynthesis protein LarC [Ilumatobacter sp.]